MTSRTMANERPLSKPAYTYGVRKGSKAAVPVHRYFFTGAPVKFTGGHAKEHTPSSLYMIY